MKKAFKSAYLALVLLFLYAPIAVMIALSFNASKSRAVWGGFSLTWYAQLFDSPEIMQALQVTLTVAVLATLVATVIGSLGAIGIHAMKSGRANALINLSYLSMTTPDIATGVSLMLMFVFMKIPLGWGTMLMAHIAFDTPYVLFSVLPKLRQMNPSTYEAALDLGCKPGNADSASGDASEAVCEGVSAGRADRFCAEGELPGADGDRGNEGPGHHFNTDRSGGAL